MPFPTPPGPRIAYDDPNVGEVLIHQYINYGGGLYSLSPLQASWMNGNRAVGISIGAATSSTTPSESDYGGLLTYNLWYGGQIRNAFTADSCTVTIMLREPMDIKGALVVAQRGRGGSGAQIGVGAQARIYGSQDATNPIDGVWTTLGTVPSPWPGGGSYSMAGPSRAVSLQGGLITDRGQVYWNNSRIPDNNQHNLIALDLPRARALRFRFYSTDISSTYDNEGGFYGAVIHLYGEVSSIASDQRVAFWHPTLSTLLSPDQLQWGDVNISSSADKTFRIKNMSKTKGAANVLITREDTIFPISPAPSNQLMFSYDGINWDTTLTVTALAPQTVSPLIYVRRVTPANSALGLLSPRIRALAGEWT